MNENTYISFYLKHGRIHVFCKSVRAIGAPQYIRFLVNENGTSMIMEPYDKKEFQSMRVPKVVYTKKGRMEFQSMPFCRLVSHTLGWKQTESYCVPGVIIPRQSIVLFDLTSAFPIKATIEEMDVSAIYPKNQGKEYF